MQRRAAGSTGSLQKQRPVIAHHLILCGYGHWLPNDPRGSGSDEVGAEKLKSLGPTHLGRKLRQPSRQELREFYERADPLLNFERIWFDAAKRQALGESIGEIAQTHGYTVWACAAMKNHVHLCVRRHRDNALQLWTNFAETTRARACLFAAIPKDHPIWSERPYKVFLYTPDDVRRVVCYIEANPVKEGLAPQPWAFAQKYDGWPTKRDDHRAH